MLEVSYTAQVSRLNMAMTSRIRSPRGVLHLPIWEVKIFALVCMLQLKDYRAYPDSAFLERRCAGVLDIPRRQVTHLHCPSSYNASVSRPEDAAAALDLWPPEVPDWRSIRFKRTLLPLRLETPTS